MWVDGSSSVPGIRRTPAGDSRERPAPEQRISTMNEALTDPSYFEVTCSQRAYRALLPDPVPEALIEKILGAGTHAPSARNCQPWRFIVVQDPDVRAADCRRRPGGPGSASPAIPRRTPRIPVSETSIAGATSGLAEAPVIIVLCGDTHVLPFDQMGSSIYPDRTERAAGRRGTRAGLAHEQPAHLCAGRHLREGARAPRAHRSPGNAPDRLPRPQARKAAAPADPGGHQPRPVRDILVTGLVGVRTTAALCLAVVCLAQTEVSAGSLLVVNKSDDSLSLLSTAHRGRARADRYGPCAPRSRGRPDRNGRRGEPLRKRE